MPAVGPTTFQNLQTLQRAREELMKKLKADYAKQIVPFIQVIDKVMKAKGLNHFEAVKFIKENLSIYQTPGAEIFFAAALMEIVEERDLKELK